MQNRKIFETDHPRIIALFKEGKKYKEIAAEFDVSPTPIKRIVHSYGLKRYKEPRRVNQEMADSVRKDYAELDDADLMEKYNLSRSTIRLILRNEIYKKVA
jgi:Mor family transcriptional regulator